MNNEENKKEEVHHEDHAMNEVNGDGEQPSALNDGTDMDEGMSSEVGEDQRNADGQGQAAFGTITRSGGGAKSRIVPRAGKRPTGPGPSGF